MNHWYPIDVLNKEKLKGFYTEVDQERLARARRSMNINLYAAKLDMDSHNEAIKRRAEELRLINEAEETHHRRSISFNQIFFVVRTWIGACKLPEEHPITRSDRT